MSEPLDVWVRNVISTMPPSATEARVGTIIAALNAEIDDVIGLYKGLKKLDMGASKKKRVGMKVAGLKIDKSKVKSAIQTTTGATPRAEKWMTEEHIFSSKSKLATIDLHSYLAKPEAWSTLTEEEKATIRSLLPENTPFDDDGTPSAEFLKYNTDWRNGIRQLQEEVGSGRLDPEWQADAAQAMEERAAGEFDAFKEQQYEEFWGQKQKVSSHAVAGKSSQVTLEELVFGGVFLVGDVWSYTRSFGSKHLIEKDCTIGQIQGDKLVFLVPPANSKLMPARFAMDVKAAETAKFTERDETANNSGQALLESPILGYAIAHDGTFYDDGTTSTLNSVLVPNHHSDKELLANTSRIFALDHPSQVLGEPEIVRIDRPQQLERKIVELNGRHPGGLKSASAWKYFRCHRDNKDIGSLFELREAYYNRHR